MDREGARMTVLVPDYPHRKGEHCASTAMRNILAFHGLSLSEGMVFGLANGLGFFYLVNDQLSPTRMLHGRPASIERDFGRNTGVPQKSGETGDDERAWADLRANLDAGIPVMLSTDTFYLSYQNTTSHFPGHRAVAVGYDQAEGTVLIADRKLDDYQAVPMEELREARNARDYPSSCNNASDHFQGKVALGMPLSVAIRRAITRNALGMRTPYDPSMTIATPGFVGMRRTAEDLPRWVDLRDCRGQRDSATRSSSSGGREAPSSAHSTRTSCANRRKPSPRWARRQSRWTPSHACGSSSRSC